MKLNEKVDSNDAVIIQKVVDSGDITEEIYLKQLFRINKETPIHPFYVQAYNNASIRWKIHQQLEIYDLLNEFKGKTDLVLQHLQQKHESHVKYLCSDLYNEFNDSKMRYLETVFV